jgi:hypothetical protein
MTPLEEFLANQKRCEFSWRASLSRAVGGPATSLSRLATRLIWPRQLKHMRYLAPGITLRHLADGRWTILANGTPLAESAKLSQLIPPPVMPVSIVATGPSALDYPWDSVQNGQRFLIAVNGAPTMLRDLGIRPDLLVVTDREFALTGARHLAAAPDVPLAIEFLAAAALAATKPQLLTGRRFAILERVNMWHALPAIDDAVLKELNQVSGSPFIFPETKDPKCRVGWSYRPELGIFSGRTVVFGALQIAIGLGATDVEIIGMDLSGAGRAYSEDSGQRPTQLQEHYQSFILPSFQTMRRALAGSGIVVTNRSPVCPLPPEIFADFAQAERRPAPLIPE